MGPFVQYSCSTVFESSGDLNPQFIFQQSNLRRNLICLIEQLVLESFTFHLFKWSGTILVFQVLGNNNLDNISHKRNSNSSLLMFPYLNQLSVLC